jgi:hypothetical protein
MAKSGVLTPYDQTSGVVQDISSLIDALSYEETPALSSWKKVPVFDNICYWDDFALTAASATNSAIPGATFGTSSTIVRDQRSNVTQIFTKVITVSRTQNKRRKYGVGDEDAWQIQEQLKEIARDLEKALFQGTYALGTSASAPTMRGLEAAISTSTLNANGSSLTETGTLTGLLTLLQTIWVAGGRGAKTAYMNAFQKRLADGFTGVSNTRVVLPANADGLNLIYNVGVYSSSFGVVKLVLTPYATASVVSVIEDGSCEIGVFDPFQKEALGKTLDGSQWAVVGEYTLKHRKETHMGKIYGLSTS